MLLSTENFIPTQEEENVVMEAFQSGQEVATPVPGTPVPEPTIPPPNTNGADDAICGWRKNCRLVICSDDDLTPIPDRPALQIHSGKVHKMNNLLVKVRLVFLMLTAVVL